MSENLETSQQGNESEKPEVKYQLLTNNAAGTHSVVEWTQAELDDENSDYRTQNGHDSEVGLYNTKEELDRAVEDLKGKPVFAVFENNAAGEVYYSKEDNMSGNWRGSREGHASLTKEFDTEDEAKEYVAKRKE